MKEFKSYVTSLLFLTGIMGFFGQQALAAEIVAKGLAAATTPHDIAAVTPPADSVRIIRGLIITNNDTIHDATISIYKTATTNPKTGNIIVAAGRTQEVSFPSGIFFGQGDSFLVKVSNSTSVDLTIDYQEQ